MWFAYPVWLLALPVWAGFALWVFWARWERARVPFLALWQGVSDAQPSRRGFHSPPTWLWWLLLAMLLGILAAGEPRVWSGNNSKQPIQVVVDCGQSMSGVCEDGVRWRVALRELGAELAKRNPDSALQVVTVPQEIRWSGTAKDLGAVSDKIPSTGVDTSGMAEPVVSRVLRGGATSALVVTDQPISQYSGRVVRVAPDEPICGQRIVRLAAREVPSPQVMVQVQNVGTDSRATLLVETAGQRLNRDIDLPSAPGKRNYFVDVSELGETVSASVRSASPSGVGSDAWLARADASGAIVALHPLDPTIERMIDVYRAHRLAQPGAQPIPIVQDIGELKDNQRGVVVSESFEGNAGESKLLDIADHPITRGISWGSLPMSPSTQDAPAGWTPLLRLGGKTLLAATESPARRVWVGVATPAWAETAQFVIFWSNVFDWINQQGTQFASEPLTATMSEWQPMSNQRGMPGIYQRDDGLRRAFNCAEAEPYPAAPMVGDWRKAAMELVHRQAGRGISDWCLVATLVALLASVICLGQRPRTALSEAATAGEMASTPAANALRQG